ncbi:MAG: hypothetical protein ACTS4U_01365 [Candidatus Hodgkinia cicadicola]
MVIEVNVERSKHFSTTQPPRGDLTWQLTHGDLCFSLVQVPLNFVPSDVETWTAVPGAKRVLLISPKVAEANVSQFTVTFGEISLREALAKVLKGERRC